MSPVLDSALLKHAFREVTFGFRKGTVPGRPLPPSQAPKNLVPLKGHILVKNM